MLSTPGDAPDAIDVDKRLLRSLRAFHTGLGDYVNACRSVIYYVKTKEGANKGNQEFKAAANPYYDHVTKVDNFIKHQQRALRTVYAAWPHGQIIGYQVEGAVAVGVVGPERQIHRYHGTAFSLNRALKYHACHIYLMASETGVRLHFSKLHSDPCFRGICPSPPSRAPLRSILSSSK